MIELSDMASRSSKSNPKDSRDSGEPQFPDAETVTETFEEVASDPTQQGFVENFTYEASAGRNTSGELFSPGGSSVSPTISRRQRRRRLHNAAEDSSEVASTPQFEISSDSSSKKSSGDSLEQETGSTHATKTPAITKRVRRGLPSSTLSLALHVVILLALSFSTLALPREEEDLQLVATSAPYESIEEFQEVEIDPNEDLESLDEQLSAELADPGESMLGDLSAESALAEVTGDTALTSDISGDTGELFGDLGSGESDHGDGAATASFFGTKVEGKRIVFVLDNSGDMQGGRLETVINELIGSVEAMTSRQRFYVIFHSDTVYPLFYPQPATEFVLATDRNKEILKTWLETVELCYGDSVDKAVVAAASIRPDVVYLLSNGIMSDKKFEFLQSGGDGSFPIHTVGVGMGKSTAARIKLQEIAESNGGTFREAEIAAEMKELAREKARPYNNKGPGQVWGINVKAR